MQDLAQELKEIKERNARVEQDKAWEISWTRRFFIALVTYIFAGFYMSAVNLPHAWVAAFIPTSGYVLSTLSIPFVRKVWANKIYKNQ